MGVGVAGDRVAEFNRRIRADFPNNAAFSRLPTVPCLQITKQFTLRRTVRLVIRPLNYGIRFLK